MLKVWQGGARQGMAWHGLARRGQERHGLARHGKDLWIVIGVVIAMVAQKMVT